MQFWHDWDVPRHSQALKAGPEAGAKFVPKLVVLLAALPSGLRSLCPGAVEGGAQPAGCQHLSSRLPSVAG